MDESGSMGNMGVEPIQAINSFIKEQQETIIDTGSTFTLWKFDTTVKNMIDDLPLKDVKEFTDYVPKGMTALYDAIGNAIKTKKTKTKIDNVICVIVTDGIENSSTEFTSADIMAMIKTMENNHNWKFIYLGANQDVIAVGGNMGLNTNLCSVFDASPGGLLTATRNISQSISLYRTESMTASAVLSISRNESPPKKQKPATIEDNPLIIPISRNLRVNINVVS